METHGDEYWRAVLRENAVRFNSSLSTLSRALILSELLDRKVGHQSAACKGQSQRRPLLTLLALLTAAEMNRGDVPYERRHPS